MSKNKNRSSQSAEKPEKPAGAPPKQRAPRKPMGTVPERLCAKADAVYAEVNDVLKMVEKRSAPSGVVSATKTLVGQVEAWRDVIFGLKTSGWLPPEKASSKEIVEGDGIKIGKDHFTTYKYIFDALGVAEGDDNNLVAGTVMVAGLSARVLVKEQDLMDSTNPEMVVKHGQIFGYVPRNHLVKR